MQASDGTVMEKPDAAAPDSGQESGDQPEPLGCEHYKRKCCFISPCCGKEYGCRVCHDNSETHEINRRDVEKVKCLKCHQIQPVQKECEKCGIVMGNYFCQICCLFDDETNKGQFHCDGCGLCRIGGKDNFFHCPKCDMCLSVQLKAKHKCVEESSRRNCAVCLEDLHTSRIDARIPSCGHLIHGVCLEQCITTGNYACPTCGESLINMKEVWKQLDKEIEVTKMPDEYKDFHVQVLCRDCHKESRVLFHVIGLKCKKCGSYNTCRSAEPGKEETLPSSSSSTGLEGTTTTDEVSSNDASGQSIEGATGGVQCIEGATGGAGDSNNE